MKSLLIATVCLLASCSDQASLTSNATLDAEVGMMRSGTSERVSGLYGGASEADSPDVFSQGRQAVICDTPSLLVIERDDVTGSVFTTAARCTTTPNKPLMFSVLQRNGDALKVLYSLVVNDNDWHPIRIDLPDDCQQILLNASYEMPSEAKQPGPEIAWATPQLSPATHPAQSDVIFISIDTMRSAALSHAPFLSALIAQGRQYTNAYSPSNWTLPAFASLVSGLTPQQHGSGRGPFSEVAGGINEQRDFFALAEMPTFAKSFTEAGYATAFIHQNPFLESWTNIQQGFGMYARTADRVDASQQLASAWWNGNQHRARLLLMHFMEPHFPYTDQNDSQNFFGKDIHEFFIKDHTPQQRREYFSVDEEVKDKVHAAYLSQITKLDKQLELTISALSKTSSDYVIVIHVDHGEELWDHGSFEHGHSFADCLVKVPLAIIHSGHIAAEQINKPVATHHIGNYLLEYLNIDSDMPASALGNDASADRAVTTSHPLYRSDIGGKIIHDIGSYSIITNEQLEYHGQPMVVPDDVMATLRQLGYSGD